MGRYTTLILINVLLISIIPFMFVAKSRVERDGTPAIHPILDMDAQPKFKAQSTHQLFADNRAMRPQVPGTISRELDVSNQQLLTGRIGDSYVTEIPMEISDTLIQRGQEQYNIYCATCHGYDGYGNGMVSQRAEQLEEGTWTPPTSYHTQQVLERSDGHLYNTIKNGIRNMPAYASQISVEDRWAIVAYVRALQRTQNATLEDVPEEYQDNLR